MSKNPKMPVPDGFVDSEPEDEEVNDSLGTVNIADTNATDPKDEPVPESDPSSGIDA
jgi:hypothetical protein